MKLQPPTIEWREAPVDEEDAGLDGHRTGAEFLSDEGHFSSLQFIANGNLLWDVDFFEGSLEEAQDRARSEIVTQAAALGVQDFDSFVQALAGNFGWTHDQAMALAVAFVFPGPMLARERFGPVWTTPNRRGRPTRVDRAARVLKLAQAWKLLTGNDPGVFNAHFLKAFEVAAVHLGIVSMRGRPLADLQKFLEQERKKLRSEHFQWSRPTLEG